ncbi:T9SS type A sorting domain-containing protein [Maribacter sp. 2307UL18-2]|uniref:T9SS type A sorting domain-containing protein n=1 Tax=Maribacter sp. 2307UL18-2 TaxID=3386274 RepID=UPI0039BC3CF5
MKRKLLVGTLLLFSVWAGAQTIDIDDPAFEDALIALGHDSNPVRDGVISIVDADMVTNLNVSNRGISDLSGLEFFSAVETLDVSGNDLDELVLQNLSLVTIKADNCNLAGKAIFFKNEAADAFLTNVIDLSLNDNGISGNSNGIISFGGVENVRFLSIRGNNIEAVNLKNTSKIELLDADNCPNLSVLNDLDGLQNLKGLILSDCSFTSLDVMDNAALESLVVSNNSIAEIVVDQNPALAIFRGSNNAFTALDFSGNSALTAVDVSSNAQLSTLNVANGNNAALTALNAQATALSCIQVDNPGQAENAPSWEKDATAVYAGNCKALNNVVEVFFESAHTIEDGFYIFDSKIELGFDLRDKNGIELPSSTLAAYEVILNTEENNNLNPATKGVDFEALTNEPIAITTIDMGIDRIRELEPKGDQLFEADEYFFIDISTNDPNISLKNAVNGVVRFPVKIIDNEVTDVTLSVEKNGVEGSQNAILVISSSLVNETGAPLPFNVVLNGGDALINQDYEPFTGQATIADGASSTEFEIVIKDDDNEPEDLESFNVTITYAGDLNDDTERVKILNGGTEPVTITDNDSAPNGPFLISSSLTGAGIGPYYEVGEGTNFSLNLNADTGANPGDTFVVSVNYQMYSIIEEEREIFGSGIEDQDEVIGSEIAILRQEQSTEDDVTLENENTTYTFTVQENAIDGQLNFSILDDSVNEDTEELVITINVESTNVGLSNTAVYILKITDNDPIEVIVSLENAGPNDNYSIEEGKEFNLVLNPLDPSESMFNLDLSIDKSTAGFGETRDFDYSIDFPLTTNFDETVINFTVLSEPNSMKIPFRVALDDIPNENEEIVISLPKPDGNYFYSGSGGAYENGGITLTIPITEVEPYFVDVQLGTALNKEITEGNAFEVSFRPLDVPEDLVQPTRFDVDMQFGTGNNLAENNVDFELIGVPQIELKFNTEVTIQSIVDGIQEDEDETIQILLPKPEGAYRWSNIDGKGTINADGDLIFEIKLKDKENQDALADYAMVFKDGNGSIYQDYPIKVSETGLLNFSIVPQDNSTVEKGFLITARDGSAKADENDFYTRDGNLVGPRLFDESFSLDIYFEDDDPSEGLERFFLDITPTTKNYNLDSPLGDRIAFGETFTVEIEIENNPEAPLSQDSQFITDFVTNAERITKTTSAFAREFSATEGNTVEILLGALQPNTRQGETYTLGYELIGGNNLDANDYELTIENAEGVNLQQGNDAFLFEVDNSAAYNAKVSIALKADGVDETVEKLTLKLFPQILITTPDEEGPASFEEIAGFQSAAIEGSSLEYEFLISDTASQEIVYAVLSNSGGIEGQTNDPDIITCSLFDNEGNPFTAHTSEIRIELKDEIDTNDDLRINPWEYELDTNIFVFPAGNSTATIKATYLDERVAENGTLDALDVDCNYYTIKIDKVLDSAGYSIAFDENWRTIKVIDKTEYLVFVDLILNENIRAVAFNQLQDPDYFSSVCDGECIDYYEVEENSTIEFNLDAANGVPIIYQYTLDLDFDADTNKSFRFNKDVSLPTFGDQTKGIKITVDEKDIDETIQVKVENDNEDDSNEPFSIRFAEPNNEKTYRFSKRDSRSYGDSFKFRTIDAVPVYISVVDGTNIIEEEDEDSYGEVQLRLDRKTPTSLKIPFELASGTNNATFGTGEGGDYTIISSNRIEVSGNRGVIHVNRNQQIVTFRIKPENDPLDEGEESIKITLKDDFGYSLGNSFEELVIRDDDKTGLPVSIVTDDFLIFENPAEKNSEEIEFKLGEDKIAPNDLRLDFSIVPGDPTALFNEDFKLYEILSNGTEREITSSEGFYLTIPSQSTTAKLRIMALPDDETNEDGTPEGDERVEIVLRASDLYSATDPKTVTVEIKDDAEGGEEPSADTNSIVAQVTSSSCPNTKSGRIALKNGTDFDYKASLYTDGKVVGQPKTLKANTVNFSNLFEKLEAATYTIFLSYSSDEELDRPSIELPSFTMTIRNEEEVKLIRSTTSKALKLVNLKVSGSTLYYVKNNGTEYEFKVNTANSVELEVPLQYGQNKISIKGNSECQGILETTIVLDNVVSYPNPTTDVIYVAGFQTGAELRIQVFDLNGRMLSDTPTYNSSSTLEIPLYAYARGTYFCKILSDDGSSSTFKIVKK